MAGSEKKSKPRKSLAAGEARKDRYRKTQQVCVSECV
jgi:hypothetical protein